jgi:hypothetical protein
MYKRFLYLALILCTGSVGAQTYEQIGTDAQYKEDFIAVDSAQMAEDATADFAEEAAFLADQRENGNPELTDVQWSGRRRWACFARNRRGETFSGFSHSRAQARRNAMRRCGNNSGSCFLSSCR